MCDNKQSGSSGAAFEARNQIASTSRRFVDLAAILPAPKSVLKLGAFGFIACGIGGVDLHIST